MTLKELMEVVDRADNSKTAPKHRELLSMEATIVVKKEFAEGAEITVFSNGYVLMVDDKRRTVFRLHDNEDVEFKAAKGNSSIFNRSFFENEKWYVYLLLVGSERLEKNQDRLLGSHKVYSSDAVGLHEFFTKEEPDVLEHVIREETEKEIKKKITERQQYAINAYYCEEISQEVIAENLGISQQATSKLIKRSIQEIREVMHVEETSIKRTRNKK